MSETKYTIFECTDYHTFKMKAQVTAENKEKAKEKGISKGWLDLSENTNEYLIVNSSEINSITGEKHNEVYNPVFKELT